MYKPIFRITPYLLNQLTQAGELRSWIENSALGVQWISVLQKNASTRLAHFSTSIEGNILNLEQVECMRSHKMISAPKKDQIEVRQYWLALNLTWKNKRKKELKTEDILKTHKILMKGLLPSQKTGKYKDKPNHVINEKGVVVFHPPSPQKTPRLIEELLLWINSKETLDLHPIIVSATFHHQLVSIHPFSDGNGRISRLFGLWILFQWGFDSKHLFALDEFFAHDRQKYYFKLQQARDLDDDLTHWIEYVAEGMVWVLELLKQRIQELKIKVNVSVQLTPQQEKFILLLHEKKILSTRDFEYQFKLTRARVNQILKPLIKAKIVEKMGQSRATRYRLKN